MDIYTHLQTHSLTYILSYMHARQATCIHAYIPNLTHFHLCTDEAVKSLSDNLLADRSIPILALNPPPISEPQLASHDLVVIQCVNTADIDCACVRAAVRACRPAPAVWEASGRYSGVPQVRAGRGTPSLHVHIHNLILLFDCLSIYWPLGPLRYWAVMSAPMSKKCIRDAVLLIC